MKLKYRSSEYLASEILKGDLIIEGYQRSPRFPIDWPKVAADIVLSLAAQIEWERNLPEDYQPGKCLGDELKTE